MIHPRASLNSRPVAVLVRLAAFLIAAAGVLIVPWMVVAAATSHISTAVAFATGGSAIGLAVLASLAARRLDPLRTS